MNGAFYIGATGLDAQQRALDVVANNISNLNTPAFRRSSVRFGELVAVRRDENDLPLTSTDRSGSMSGVQVAGTGQVWAPGELRRTGGAMDVAIQGDGFLELLGPAGQILLSRGGTLTVNDEGYLAGADGTPLRAMISVPQGAGQLSIGADGAVSAMMPGEASPRAVGQIDLAVARNPDTLVDRGGGYFEAADDAELLSVKPGDGAGTLVQGSIEQANVNLSDEMVSLMLVQRAYAADAQVVQAGDQMMSIVNGLRR